MNETLKKIESIGIVPVIKIQNTDNAVPLARALCAGGIPAAEITFRAAGADIAIKAIRESIPDMVVGAGTVLTIEQADRAIASGAHFIVTPGFNPNVVAHCIKKGVTIVPGCNNPSDMERAIEAGLDVVKFFPAEQSGGVAFLKAVSAPYSSLKFMPTGGVNAKNLNDYLSFNKIAACGGSWMVKSDLIDAGEFDKITALCREAMQTMLGFGLMHVGINSENEAQALATAKLFGEIFGFDVKAGNSSVFCDRQIEVMKTPFRGKNGHIAIGTNSIKRAVAYLELRGFEFDHSSAKADANGNYPAIYFKDEIGGFAVHLLQR